MGDNDTISNKYNPPELDFQDFYLQTEGGAVKRITLPADYYAALCHLHTHNEGRHASYLDMYTRLVLKEQPELRYAEALITVLGRFYDDERFVDKMLEVVDHDPARLERDVADFGAVQEAKEETWRRAHGYSRLAKLPPLFD